VIADMYVKILLHTIWIIWIIDQI